MNGLEIILRKTVRENEYPNSSLLALIAEMEEQIEMFKNKISV